MSLCDQCYAPGACCRGFSLSGVDGGKTYWIDAGLEGVLEQLRAAGLPDFTPTVEVDRWVDEESGREYAYFKFACRALMPDGRCGNYENRPELCRTYEPGSDPICVHWRGAEGFGG